MRTLLLLLVMAIAAPSLAQPNLLDGLKREAVITFQRTTMGGQVTVLFYADGRLKVHSYHADTVTEGRCDTAKVLRIARLAKAINVPARRINEIVQGKRGITPDTALRLSLFFKMSEGFWLNLQTRYDLETAKDHLRGRLEKEVTPYEFSNP